MVVIKKSVMEMYIFQDKLNLVGMVLFPPAGI